MTEKRQPRPNKFDVRWPPGTRFKDRDQIEANIEKIMAAPTPDNIVELIELCLAAGKRRVPSHVWTHT